MSGQNCFVAGVRRSCPSAASCILCPCGFVLRGVLGSPAGLSGRRVELRCGSGHVSTQRCPKRGGAQDSGARGFPGMAGSGADPAHQG